MTHDPEQRIDAALEQVIDPVPTSLADRIHNASRQERNAAADRVRAADVGVAPSTAPRASRSRMLMAVAVACYALGTITAIAIDSCAADSYAAPGKVTSQEPPRELHPKSVKELRTLLSDLETIHVHTLLGRPIGRGALGAGPVGGGADPWEFVGDTVGEPLTADGRRLLADDLQGDEGGVGAAATHAPSMRVVLGLGAPRRYIAATVDYHSQKQLRVGDVGRFALSNDVALRLRKAVQESERRTRMQRGIVETTEELHALPGHQTSLICFALDQGHLTKMRFPALQTVDLAGLRKPITAEVFAWLVANPVLQSLTVMPGQLRASQLEQLARLPNLGTLIVDGHGSPQRTTAKSCSLCHQTRQAEPAPLDHGLKGLRGVTKIRRLGLRSLVVPEQVTAQISQMPQLETLDLTGANVLNLPTAALKNAPVLTEIILRRATGFTPALVDTLASLTNLRQLDLRETAGLGDKQVRQLVKALPKCEILLPTERR